ncbi:hypothetical protein JAAARDRAFT_159072 [Jaapia argillacea MUCL 33604]|uniref:Methyltransferase domain-containing protein n=1 Tax=Jaapia argillacea MUCL 33604 TaxID=933084 RepID=A0A067PPI4_9AGAM|nr:hypothetical protein JAAARDRAFT_159072 [Jaapia argillacea MUCL 33604]
MTFYARHPRYSIFLIVCLFITLLMFFNSSPGGPDGGAGRAYPFQRRPPTKALHTEEVIDMTESSYREALRERQRMIRKWGPTPRDVDAFPSHGEFYTLWDFFIPAFQCPHRVQRIGTLGDGGKWMCGLDRVVKKPKCVIYSFGVNGESSFESSILERGPGCEVWGYDFSVNSFGPEITSVPNLDSRAHFYPYALGPSDAPTSDPPMFTLQTLMKRNGHSFIDILKVDIEGAEFESLNSFIRHFTSATPDNGQVVLPIGQLQLEIHARDATYAQFNNFLKWWEELERAGLRPFWTEPNLVYVNLIRGVAPDLVEYSFMNIRGHHELVADDL